MASLGAVLIYDIVALLNNDEKEEIQQIISLRLVCKDWNETFINASDYWQRLMLNNLKKLMKARGFTDQVVLPRIVCSRRKLMLKSIRNWFLTRQSIQCLNNFLSVYNEIGNYVNAPAILNETNNTLVSEMINQLIPNLFLTKYTYSEGPYYQLDSNLEITISDIQNDELTKLNFSIFHCNYDSEREVKIYHDNYEFLRNHVPPKSYNILKCKSDIEYISYLMKKVGLREEMINSNQCLREFLISIYWNGTSGNLVSNVIERDVFTISGIY